MSDDYWTLPQGTDFSNYSTQDFNISSTPDFYSGTNPVDYPSWTTPSNYYSTNPEGYADASRPNGTTPGWTPSDAMSGMGTNVADAYGQGGPSTGVYGVPGGNMATETAGNWLQQMGTKYFGPGSFLGGTQGAFPNQEKNGWLQPIMSGLSGLYGMSLANEQRKMARQAVERSSPWFSSGGVNLAGDQLKRVISGDFAGDKGFDIAQQAAARSSANQPGGFAASAAATAALRYQNERIGALGGPAGVGFNPAASYSTALGGLQGANEQASRSLGSIGYGMTGNQVPPWLTQYLIQNGMPTR
tara:strand:- start:25 stop:927 length:903 start_codon:yes stop_codon:yes gene_type:complete